MCQILPVFPFFHTGVSHGPLSAPGRGASVSPGDRSEAGPDAGVVPSQKGIEEQNQD